MSIKSFPTQRELIALLLLPRNQGNILLYTQTTWRCGFQLELKTPLGKALIEENGCSLVEINHAA